MTLYEMKQERHAALTACETILARAEGEKRQPTAQENQLMDEHMASVKTLNPRIEQIESRNTLLRNFGGNPAALLLGGSPAAREDGKIVLTETEGRARASQYRTEFSQWMGKTLQAIGGLAPKMEAADPSGAISIGTGSGMDSVASTVPVEVLPHLPSYYNLDSFGLAGAFQIFTDHTRPLVKPVLSAGAADSVYAELTAPTASQPFGLSSFTFGGARYARLVLASYEALMNSELPLQGVILDELLSSLATTFTTAITTAMNTALTGASSTLYTGTSGSSGGSIYTNMIDLRHAVPPRFDLPTNKWMLSRSTLATIKNCRAVSSGVPMFDANSDTIFGKPYVINDNFDATCGAGFVVYGSWADGCWLRKTPVFTRVFLERFSANGELGFQTTQFLDSHFLAELAGAAQPPTNQPLYYTSLVGCS